MKRVIIILIIFLCADICFGKSNVCLTLTNYGQHDVTFTSNGGPGYPSIAQPLQTIILPEDEMAWACPNDDNNCSVSIRDNITNDRTIIRHLPNGARIIYREKGQYYVDPNANNTCQ